MSNFEFDFHLPKLHKALLLEIVKLARKHNVISINYSSWQTMNNVYSISVHFDKADNISMDLPEDPAFAFDVLEFVKYDEESHIIVLKPKAFKWADYENKNPFIKFLVRLPSAVRDIMIFIAFVLSLALTILQILQSLQPTP